jgi:hypothetical protein
LVTLLSFDYIEAKDYTAGMDIEATLTRIPQQPIVKGRVIGRTPTRHQREFPI